MMAFEIDRTDDEWRDLLTPEQFHVCRCGGTEIAFTGRYWDHFEEGLYACIACGHELFSSAKKFDSGSGWPSFSFPIASDRLGEKDDFSADMERIEVHCACCDSHLGHVFDGGPEPHETQFYVNSVALRFIAKR